METRDAFDAVPDGEFLEFDKIENPPFPNPDLCAFIKLAEIMACDGDIIIGAGHDVIFLQTPERIELNDAIYLHRCGVRWSADCDGLEMFA